MPPRKSSSSSKAGAVSLSDDEQDRLAAVGGHGQRSVANWITRIQDPMTVAREINPDINPERSRAAGLHLVAPPSSSRVPSQAGPLDGSAARAVGSYAAAPSSSNAPIQTSHAEAATASSSVVYTPARVPSSQRRRSPEPAADDACPAVRHRSTHSSG